MWLIIKRKSDYEENADPLCMKIANEDELHDALNGISNAMSSKQLFQAGDNYFINPEDILSVKIYDENECIENTQSAKPPKRRLNEG